MAYRTILVSLGMDPQAKPRLSAALELARQHQARVLGCFANTWSDVLFHDRQTRTMEHAKRALEESSRRCQQEFLDACKAGIIDGTFERKAKPTRKIEDLITASYGADLCIVSRTEQAGLDEGDLFTTLAEGVVMGAGCPVLVLPDNPGRQLGRNVLVAWKARREASRALRDSLPLLHKANSLTLMTIGAPDESDSLAPARAFLDAHNVIADFYADPAEDATAGEVMLNRASLVGADTLVMGAYGHARLRELVFGGATRHVLGSSKIALLMSH